MIRCKQRDSSANAGGREFKNRRGGGEASGDRYITGEFRRNSGRGGTTKLSPEFIRYRIKTAISLERYLINLVDESNAPWLNELTGVEGRVASSTGGIVLVYSPLNSGFSKYPVPASLLSFNGLRVGLAESAT